MSIGEQHENPLSIYLTALCYTTGIVILSGTFAVQAWSECPTIRGTGVPAPTPHESSHKARSVKPDHPEDWHRRQETPAEVETATGVDVGGVDAFLGASRPFGASLQGEREKPEAGSDRSAGDSAQAVVPPPLWTTGKHGRQHTETRVPSRPELSFHAYSSSVTGREWTPSRGTLRSDWDREPRLSKHGVRRVPARDVVLEVTETGRGPFLQAFRGGAAWKDTQPSVETRGARSNPQVINPSLVVNGKYASWPSLASVRGHVGEPTRAQSTITGIKPGHHHLKALATAAAHLCGVPVRLFHSLIARESSWNPRARSSSGALGLGQLMPAAAKEMGVEDRLDPWQNALGAACFLRKQYDRAGSWRKALLSYHAGPNRVRTSQASHDYAQDIIEGSAN